MQVLKFQSPDETYPASLRLQAQIALSNWVDSSGHMKFGHFGIAFDIATEEAIDGFLGIGSSLEESHNQCVYVAQSHFHFLRKVKEGERFNVFFRLLGHDQKSVHYFAEMIAQDTQALCATREVVMTNMDAATGNPKDFPEFALSRLASMLKDHSDLPPAPQIGAPIGL